MRDRKFTPLGMPNEEILHLLLAKGKITFLPLLDPNAKRYDPSKVCVFHSNSPGHSTEECWALKHKIQNLIDQRELVMTSNTYISMIEECRTEPKASKYL